MKSLFLARILLLAAAGEEYAEHVAGDLEEEFRSIRSLRGAWAGHRWYAWQVVRSVLPLLNMRARSGELTPVLLCASFGVAFPLLLLDRLWSFVYSQIPLKDGLHRAPEFLAVNALSASIGAAIGGAGTTSMRSAAIRAAAAAVSAGFALWLSAGAAPAIYVSILLLAAPASSLITFMWRRTA